MYLPNLKFVEILHAYHTIYLCVLDFPQFSIAVLSGSCNHPILGKGRPQGLGMVPFKRALVSSYRPSIVTFFYLYAFKRYRRVCFCSPARYFSLPHLYSLPKISPCSPGSSQVAHLFAIKSEGVGLIVCAISFRDFRPM